MDWHGIRGQLEVLAANHKMSTKLETVVIDNGEFVWGMAFLYVYPTDDAKSRHERALRKERGSQTVQAYSSEARHLKATPPLTSATNKRPRELSYSKQVELLGFSYLEGMAQWSYEIVIAPSYTLARRSYHQWKKAADAWKEKYTQLAAA